MNAEIDISNVVLHTERLTLRPWKPEDCYDMYEYAHVDGVGQMAGWSPHKNVEESQMIIQMFISGKKTFAIEYEGKVIGSFGIEKYLDDLFPDLDELKGRSLGFVLSKDYWGRGLMPEAVREVMRYLFEELNLDFLMCGYFKWNQRSRRVQEKCGFHPYGISYIETGYSTVEETVENIITRQEYLNGKKGR